MCDEPKPTQERRYGYQQPETPNRTAKFQWKGQRLEIRILERFRREEKEDAKFWDRYEYHPMGQLECSMIGACGYEGRQSWKDGKIQRIEQFPAQIVSCLKQGSEARERYLIQCAKEEERRKKIEAVLSALRSQRYREQSAVEDLMKEALHLSEAERLRAYADAAETRIREVGHSSLEPGSDASLWLQWIRTRADMQAPLRKGAAPWRRVCRRIIRLEE